MQLFYEIFPVFLFFLAFKFYGIYVATTVGIVATLAQTLLTRFVSGKWDRKQIVTCAIFVVFGGMTLYFHDPIFVKWKPTIVFWIFGVIILFSHFFMQKTITQRLMENVLQGKGAVPVSVWKRLNLIWAVFFLLLGAVNLYVAYSFSNDAWVNFKFYGISGALLLLSIFQAIYLLKYVSDSKA